MGIIISRFRKKKTTLDILEDLEKRIRDMETQGVYAAQRCRRVTTNLVLYAVGLYVILVAIWYWYWPPLNVKQQFLRLPALIFTPILIILLRRIVQFYYTRKIRNNDTKLLDMRKEKKKIIEEVMDQETYKVAREILRKYAPDCLGEKSAYASQLLVSTQPQKMQSRVTSPINNDIRRRPVVQSSPVQSSQLPMTRASVNSPDFRPNMQIAKPFQPYDRTFFDRILEYIIGDGPSNRFALICRACRCHNGMALKEEFEYLQFRCYSCQHWNPARKQRPHAPKLEDSPSHSPSRKDNLGHPSSTIKTDEDSSSSESEDSLVDEEQFPNEKAEENNETAELQLDKDDSKSEEKSSTENDCSSKETGNDFAASQENETPENHSQDITVLCKETST